jgi:hypothetical protein
MMEITGRHHKKVRPPNQCFNLADCIDQGAPFKIIRKQCCPQLAAEFNSARRTIEPHPASPPPVARRPAPVPRAAVPRVTVDLQAVSQNNQSFDIFKGSFVEKGARKYLAQSCLLRVADLEGSMGREKENVRASCKKRVKQEVRIDRESGQKTCGQRTKDLRGQLSPAMEGGEWPCRGRSASGRRNRSSVELL